MIAKNINKQIISNDDEDCDLIIDNDDVWIVNNDKSLKKIVKKEKTNDNYQTNQKQNKLKNILYSGGNDNQNYLEDFQTPKFNENFLK